MAIYAFPISLSPLSGLSFYMYENNSTIKGPIETTFFRNNVCEVFYKINLHLFLDPTEMPSREIH